MKYTNSQESHALATTAPRGMGFDLSPQSFDQALTFANMLADIGLQRLRQMETMELLRLNEERLQYLSSHDA